MRTPTAACLKIVLLRPGATDFDIQGRIRGTLDIPLNAEGASQVARAVEELREVPIECVYTGPSQSDLETAEALARSKRLRARRCEQFRNLDHGLWHGKRVEELRQQQPKFYRLIQDDPDQLFPPGGEPLEAARQRVRRGLARLRRRHRHGGTIAIVVSEPLASLVACELRSDAVGDLWKAECGVAGWDVIDVDAD